MTVPVLVSLEELFAVLSDGLIGAKPQVGVHIDPVLVPGVLDATAQVNVHTPGCRCLNLRHPARTNISSSWTGDKPK